MNNNQINTQKYEPIRDKALPPLPKVAQIAMLIDAKNYSQVDLYAQHILRVLPSDTHANVAAVWVAHHFGYNEHKQRHLEQALNSELVLKGERSINQVCDDLSIESSIITEQLPTAQTTACRKVKYHIAKAWGFGFGSEMSALMGQAYMAEAMGRELIVHWGSNFLYRPNTGSDCVFHHFFEPFNNLTIADAQSLLGQAYPPKWSSENILDENIGKKTGEYSKLSALYFLSRSEPVTVSDYYAGVVNIKPWVDKSSPLSHLSYDDAYRYLAKKYCRPKANIVAEVDAFVSQNLNTPFVAVHARGSDKDEGYRALTSIPQQTLECAKQRLEAMPKDAKLFLMTDDTGLLNEYEKTFGDRLVQTDCQRCDNEVGVHYDQNTNKLNAGREMLIDMLIAARANCFIGLGLSNPSQLILYFGDFSDDNYVLFGENRLKQLNTHLYKTISVRR